MHWLKAARSPIRGIESMRSQRQDGRLYRKSWIQPLTSAAAVAAVGIGVIGEPAAALGQGFKLFGRKAEKTSEEPAPKKALPAPAPTGFEKTVRQLMEQSRREAAAGKVDAAIRTAERARKISQAASTMIGDSSDCSPAATDQFYHEMLALRPAATPSPAATMATAKPVKPTVVEDVFEEPVPAPQAPVVTAPKVAVREVKPSPSVEKWQPLISSADELPAPVVAKVIAAPAIEEEEAYFPAETIEPVVTENDTETPAVVLGRPERFGPVATEPEPSSSLDIVGGERKASLTLRPRVDRPLPTDIDLQPKDAEPDWERTDAPLTENTMVATTDETDAQLIRELNNAKTPVEIIEPVAETPEAPTVAALEVTAPAVLKGMDWNSSGAVVHKQRIGRAESLYTDGWQSPVTRAGGVVNTPVESVSEDKVATTAFRSTTEKEATSVLPFAPEEPLRKAPPPPNDVDEDEVALQAPTVWKREGLATVTTAEPTQNNAQSSAWRRFSAWSKSRGWPATSAAIGLAAAALALAAFALALFPHRPATVKSASHSE